MIQPYPKIEIMSLAGSYESLMAAIQGDADSVNFGAGILNMRARSSLNFTPADLAEIAAICRENKVRHSLEKFIKLRDSQYNIDIYQVIILNEKAIQKALCHQLCRQNKDGRHSGGRIFLQPGKEYLSVHLR